ncbi:hypothetical protein DFH08DRAFT_861060 [Mycena albidolilacea]|uniref:Uncharacterized protein n=1 Tax=Mycena albidolilacea TaxID=1033008 RepID=A0AAD7A655_9AGAR|nr:hypothetical protein DFH08DRAFT_861060 [Mycena albidolilacea]
MIVSGETSHEISGYARVASIAIAFYDYLQTLPFELRMWKSAWKSRQLTFTAESCQRYYLIPPVLKVVQTMVSQAILASNVDLAYNLSRKWTKIGYTLIFLFVLASCLEWLTTLHRRKMLFSEDCASSSPTSLWGGWVHYAVSTVYDFCITVICIFFLLQLKTPGGSMMARVTRMMLVDGVWYFIALAMVNFLNLAFYRAANEVQVRHISLASLGYCVTWIMSQRLLIHLHEASVERRNESIDAAVTITQHLASARDVSRAVRSQFESKNGAGFDLTVPDFDLESLAHVGSASHEDTEVHVRIERTVRMERMPRTYELEDYSRNARSTITSRSKH